MAIWIYKSRDEVMADIKLDYKREVESAHGAPKCTDFDEFKEEWLDEAGWEECPSSSDKEPMYRWRYDGDDKFELLVCTDCYLAFDSGDTDDHPDADAYLSQVAAEEAQGKYTLVHGDTNEDEEFSWSQCDLCKTHLGGARHHLILMQDMG